MILQLTIDSRVRLDVTGIPRDARAELHAAFEHVNPQREALKRIGKPHWKEPTQYETWREVERPPGGVELSLPRGGLDRVRRVLARHEVPYRVVDQRGRADWWQASARTIPVHNLTLYPDQQEVVDAVAPKEQALWRAPTGSGKTSTAFALIAKLDCPTLVLVPNGVLFDQWVRRAEVELGLNRHQVGVIRGPKRKHLPLTVGMVQTVARSTPEQFAAINAYFAAVLADEAQIFAAQTFYDAVDPLACRFRFATTADERRNDRKEFLVHDLFGEPVLSVDKKRLVDAGRVLDVEVRVVPTDFRAPWYGVPVGDYDEREVDVNRLLDEMAVDPQRQALAVATVMRVVALGHQAIALSRRREHCLAVHRALVERGVRSGFLIGGDDYRLEFEDARKGLESGAMRAGVGTYQASGTGLDLPAVGYGVALTPIAGNRYFFNQVCGRLCRAPKGKRRAVLAYLWDRHVYPGHLRNLTRWNKRVTVLVDGQWVDARQYLRERAA